MRRRITFTCLVMVLVASGSSARAGDIFSALKALDAFTSAPHVTEKEPVVGMVGFYGQPQPPQWLILSKVDGKPKILRESVVSKGKVLAERKFKKLPAQDLPDISLDRKALKIDSPDAFAIVERIARENKVGFDSAHFQLRCRAEAEEPVWVLNLINTAQVSVGVVYLSATSGKVLRVSWVTSPVEKYSSTAVKKP